MRYPDPKVAVGVLLMGLMVSCASVGPVRPVAIHIPDALTEDCVQPAGDVSTNGALAAYILALKDALTGCSVRLQTLREWEERQHARN